MELLASIFAAGSVAATSSAAAASAAATGVAAGTGIGAAAGSSLLGTLSTVASIGSMVSAVVGGGLAYRQSQSQAALAEFGAESARLQSEEQALRIRRELVQKTGALRVAFAGSGLDISSSQAIEGGYRDEADFEERLARSGGDIAAAGSRMQAAQYRSRGYASLAEAAGRATGTLLDQKISIARRG